MHSVRLFAIAAAAAAIAGAMAASPEVAQAADPPTCANGAGHVCEHVTSCNTLQGDECSAGGESWKYYVIEVL